jgi:fatty-acyl-CoA synthase
MRSCPGVIDTVVYGVKVPGNEGRAGMAAITTTADFSLESLADHLQNHLPIYARPIFVRVCESLDTTGTFKLAKTRFVTEGYTSSDDPIYAWQSDAFVRQED